MSDSDRGLSQSIDENQAAEQHVETEQLEETETTGDRTTKEATDIYKALPNLNAKQVFLNTFSRLRQRLCLSSGQQVVTPLRDVQAMRRTAT